MQNIIKSCLQANHKDRYKASEICSMLEKEPENNKSILSKLISTVDEEDIEDNSSLFAVRLMTYYKRIDYLKEKLSTQKTLFELIFTHQSSMENVKQI